MKKKKILKILACVLTFAVIFVICVIVFYNVAKKGSAKLPSSSVSASLPSNEGSSDSAEAPEDPEPPEADAPTTSTLNGILSAATGECAVNLAADIELELEGAETYLGGAGVTEILIRGIGETPVTITATGETMSVLQATNGATLKFENITLLDATTENANLAAFENYLYLGGKLRFENCKIGDSIYLTHGAEAEFINCELVSSISRRYSVWVADGTASFEGCKFTGYRGLKIHEFEAKDEDVSSVSVNNCLFIGLSEKPGLAIGAVDEATTVSITNSTFEYCQAWDTEGSLVGEDGFYEADTALEAFTFITENNTIEAESVWTSNY